jgi:sulfite exporter TauE/SafE
VDALNLFPVMLVGLAGSVHCAGMCGGIVGALTMAPARPAFPVAVLTLPARPRAGLARVAAYNAGRIGSYAVAGAIAGGLAGGVGTLAGLAPWQAAAFWAANAMLVLLGLYLAGVFPALAQVERLGQGLWARVRPLTGVLLPADSPLKLLVLGSLWGWLPCGMVYSVLLTAALAGSAAGGAAVMLAFGIGTLPMLLALGLAGAQLRGWMQRRPVRLLCGLAVAGFGVVGLLRATSMALPPWLAALCMTGGAP